MNFTKIEPIRKGWSSDRKYYAETLMGERCLLRISDFSEREEKRQEFAIMKRLAEAGIPMSLPLAFGSSADGKNVYQILTWCDGTEAKEILPALSEREQYEFGFEAGGILKKMQGIDFHMPSENWAKIYGGRVEQYVQTYRDCGRKIFREELLLQFLQDHADCIKNRPMALMHADFQSDNMVISPDGKLFIIDFQGSGMVDPWYAMGGIMVTAEVSPQFSAGQLDSFFGGTVPEAFWEMNAFYMVAEMIHAFSVAVRLGEKEIAYSNEEVRIALEWCDDFQNFVPAWYMKTRK